MKYFALVALILLVCGPILTMQKFVHIEGDEHLSAIKTEPPRLPKDQLPSEWFWNNVDGKSYLTIVRNHHFPQYCGGCYAFATTSTLSDRIKIARNGAAPDVVISPQMVLSCTSNHGCHGGSVPTTYEYIRQFGITDETCSGYIAKGHENGAPCTDEVKCSVCDSEGNCEVPESYPVYYVEEYGRVHGEEAMMSEIYHRGPIACMLAADPIVDYTGGIAAIFLEHFVMDHIISVVGYGNDEDGTPYWLVRNSWGSFWGEDGFIRVHRGNNSLGIEDTCFFVIPKDTWTDDVRNYTTKAEKQTDNAEEDFLSITDSTPATEASRVDCVDLDPKFDGFVSQSGETPYADVSIDEVPANFDWRNVEGINYLSWTRGENSPHFCASCWAEAATSTLADRIMITRKSTFPQIGLSIQAVINCKAGGDCSGGDPLSVYEFAAQHGLPEDSCQGYLAKEREDATCGGEYLCINCHPPAPRLASSADPHNCSVIEDFRSWKVSDYGKVKGVEDMKKAIYTGGPIVCTIHATGEFEKYTSGVFRQFDESVNTTEANHAVSVVGWSLDEETGVEHWVVRNGWGSFWGELGYFRIQVGSDNLGIENNCYWATPIVEDTFVSRFNVQDASSL